MGIVSRLEMSPARANRLAEGVAMQADLDTEFISEDG